MFLPFMAYLCQFHNSIPSILNSFPSSYSLFSRCSFLYEILRGSVFLLLSVYLLVFFLNMSAVGAPLSPFLHQLLVLLELSCSRASPSSYDRHSLCQLLLQEQLQLFQCCLSPTNLGWLPALHRDLWRFHGVFIFHWGYQRWDGYTTVANQPAWMEKFLQVGSQDFGWRGVKKASWNAAKRSQINGNVYKGQCNCQPAYNDLLAHLDMGEGARSTPQSPRMLWSELECSQRAEGEKLKLVLIKERAVVK